LPADKPLETAQKPRYNGGLCWQSPVGLITFMTGNNLPLTESWARSSHDHGVAKNSETLANDHHPR
jgi:hypothetical protein